MELSKKLFAADNRRGEVAEATFPTTTRALRPAQRAGGGQSSLSTVQTQRPCENSGLPRHYATKL